jgi:hypothetical protein
MQGVQSLDNGAGTSLFFLGGALSLADGSGIEGAVLVSSDMYNAAAGVNGTLGGNGAGAGWTLAGLIDNGAGSGYTLRNLTVNPHRLVAVAQALYTGSKLAILHGANPIDIATLYTAGLLVLKEGAADVATGANGAGLAYDNAALTAACFVALPSGYDWMTPHKLALSADGMTAYLSLVAGQTGSTILGNSKRPEAVARAHYLLRIRFLGAVADKLTLFGPFFPGDFSSEHGIELAWVGDDELRAYVPDRQNQAGAAAGYSDYPIGCTTYRVYRLTNVFAAAGPKWTRIGTIRRTGTGNPTGYVDRLPYYDCNTPLSGTGATSSGATVSLNAVTALSGISTDGQYVIRLTGRTDGYGGTDIFLITGVNDGADQVTVAPTPNPAIAAGVGWRILFDSWHNFEYGHGQPIMGGRLVDGLPGTMVLLVGDQRPTPADGVWETNLPQAFHMNRLCMGRFLPTAPYVPNRSEL